MIAAISGVPAEELAFWPDQSVRKQWNDDLASGDPQRWTKVIGQLPMGNLMRLSHDGAAGLGRADIEITRNEIVPEFTTFLCRKDLKVPFDDAIAIAGQQVVTQRKMFSRNRVFELYLSLVGRLGLAADPQVRRSIRTILGSFDEVDVEEMATAIDQVLNPAFCDDDLLQVFIAWERRPDVAGAVLNRLSRGFPTSSLVIGSIVDLVHDAPAGRLAPDVASALSAVTPDANQRSRIVGLAIHAITDPKAPLAENLAIPQLVLSQYGKYQGALSADRLNDLTVALSSDDDLKVHVSMWLSLLCGKETETIPMIRKEADRLFGKWAVPGYASDESASTAQLDHINDLTLLAFLPGWHPKQANADALRRMCDLDAAHTCKADINRQACLSMYFRSGSIDPAFMEWSVTEYAEGGIFQGFFATNPGIASGQYTDDDIGVFAKNKKPLRQVSLALRYPRWSDASSQVRAAVKAHSIDDVLEQGLLRLGLASQTFGLCPPAEIADWVRERLRNARLDHAARARLAIIAMRCGNDVELAKSILADVPRAGFAGPDVGNAWAWDETVESFLIVDPPNEKLTAFRAVLGHEDTAEATLASLILDIRRGKAGVDIPDDVLRKAKFSKKFPDLARALAQCPPSHEWLAHLRSPYLIADCAFSGVDASAGTMEVSDNPALLLLGAIDRCEAIKTGKP